MPVCNHMIHRLNDMMGGGMHGGQHLGKPVKIRQVFQGRPASLVFQIPQVRGPCHRHEQAIVLSKRQIMGWIAGMIGEGLRDAGDQAAHQVTVQVHAVIFPHIGAQPFSVADCFRFPEHHTNVFQNCH